MKVSTGSIVARLMLLLTVPLFPLYGGEAAALEACYNDVFYLSDVRACLPDTQAHGSFQATVYWHYPEPAYPSPWGVGYLFFKLEFTGPVECDSVTVVESLADTLGFQYLIIDNSVGCLEFVLEFDSLIGPILTAGTRRLVDLCFAASDTGLVVIDNELPVEIHPYFLFEVWSGDFLEGRFSVRQAGDFDGTGKVGNVADAVFLVQFIFGGAGHQQVYPLADTNCDCLINVSDVVYLINFIFAGGPSPGSACG